MKVLVVSEFFWPRAAGGEVWAWELCEALAKQGHEVRVLTLAHDDSPYEQTKDGVHIKRVGHAGTGRLGRWLACRKLIHATKHEFKFRKPDVVHVLGLTVNVPISRLAKRKGVRSITGVHAYFGSVWRELSYAWPLLKMIERNALRRDKSVIIHVPSEYVQKLIIQETGVQTEVLHNWAPEHFPKPKPLENTFLFVGSLEPVKNPLACIPASKGHNLVVIGQGSLEEELRLAASDAGLSYTVINSCPREEVLAWIGGASLVLIPSLRESFSLVALEAICQGTPVSGNPVGILPLLPGVVAFPPSEIPPRLALSEQRTVQKRYAKKIAISRVVSWYGGKR